MHEIKYQGVDENKRLYELAAINWGSMTGLCEVEGIIGWAWCAFEVFRQFTGLKDKNGREIYEGDIVILSHMQDAPKGVVRWFKEQACFVVTEKPTHFAGHALFPGTDEVIGNIYENPDLLK